MRTGFLLLRCCTALILLMLAQSAPAAHPVSSETLPPPRIRLAVLGDSDSHGYQDRVYFPPGSGRRGGAWHAVTLQWTEVLDQTRHAWFDLGPRGRVGVDPRAATLADWLGRPQRSPHKEDHLYNFAVSGATCDDLNAGRWQQTRHLMNLIEQSPAEWRRAVVIIRIGINNIGTREVLEGLAHEPDAPIWTQRIDHCARAVIEAAYRLQSVEPTLRVVMVGIFNNAHWAPYLPYWQDPVQLKNIDRALDRFDRALKLQAERNSQLAFFDDRQLFAKRFGGRDSAGHPAYRAVVISEGFTLTNAAGDSPEHATLSDGHTGTAWNAVWVNHLLDVIQTRFQLDVPRLSGDEIARLVGH